MQASFFTPYEQKQMQRVGKCYDIVQMDCEHLYETGYFNQKKHFSFGQIFIWNNLDDGLWHVADQMIGRTGS